MTLIRLIYADQVVKVWKNGTQKKGKKDLRDQ